MLSNKDQAALLLGEGNVLVSARFFHKQFLRGYLADAHRSSRSDQQHLFPGIGGR
jgi:hypothetical protein